MCGNEEFEKALAKIQHDTYHNGAGTLWMEMRVQGEVGCNNAGRRAARASVSSSWFSRSRSSTSRSGQVGLASHECGMPCKQARRVLTSSTRFGRQPPTTARQDPSALPNANGVEENPRNTQDRPVTAAACQIHILHKFKFFPSHP